MLIKKLFVGFIFFVGLVNLTFSHSLHTPDVYTVRGITITPNYRAQENTLDAHLAIYQWNKDHPAEPIVGTELHVIAVKPKNAAEPPYFVCSHDENLNDLTGRNINVRNLSKNEVEALQIKQVMHGIDYDQPRKFAFLDTMLAAILQNPHPFQIWLAVKDQSYQPKIFPSDTAVLLIKELNDLHHYYLTKSEPIDIFKYIKVSAINPFLVNELAQQAKAQGLDKLGLTVFFDYESFNLPKELWETFLLHSDYAEIFNLNPNWVSLEKIMVTSRVMQKFHGKNMKIMGWGYDIKNPWEAMHTPAPWQELDAVLVAL